MGWPLSQDYNEAVQSPRTSFADPDLKGGEVILGPMGLPMPRSGNFADVYQVRGADGRMWAVKCFTRPVAGLGDRYAEIDEQLREARLPFAVGFRFLPEGIRVRGQWYPVLKMEWVEGFTLNEFVRQQANKPEQLRALLGMWVRLCKRLRDAEIAHADLQHGNVLLVPGETANKLKLRLIDYDGMWVPSLAGKPSGEAGHPAYQHPARLQGKAYTGEVDRFPHLVIGCALRAVAIAGKPLWDQFDNGDNLLFREPDFAEPSRSKLLKSLWAMDDPTITNLVALLAVSSRRPIKDTPWLDELLSGEKPKPVSDTVLAKAADLIGVEHRAARQAAPVSQLYVVPEEANAFADLWSDSNEPPRPRKKKKVSLLPFVLAGGFATLAAGVVIALVLSRGDKETTPTKPEVTKTATTAEVTPTPGKRGQLKTDWVVLPAGVPASGPKSLAEGIDPGTAPNFVQPYGGRGTAPLGMWFMPDGARAVVAQPRAIGILDLKRRSVDPAVQDVAIVRAAVTPDGRYAVIADRDKIIRGFDMRNGLELFSRAFPASPQFPDEPPFLLITPDGKRIAIAADRVGYAEWSIPDGKEVRRHESLQASLLSLSPDGTRAIASDRDGGVELWDLDTGKATDLSPAMKPTALCISTDGRRAMAAGEGPEIRVWDAKDGKRLPGLQVPFKSKVTAIVAASDGTTLVGSEDGEVGYVPESGPGGIVMHIQPKDPIVGFALTADAKHALVATTKSPVFLIRTRARPAGKGDLPESAGFLDLVRSTTVPRDAREVLVSPETKKLLVASQDRLILHDLETFRPETPLRLADGQLNAVCFGPDDSLVVTERIGEEYQTRTLNLKTSEFGPPFEIPGDRSSNLYRLTRVPNTGFVIGTSETFGDILFDTKTAKLAEGWPRARPGDAVVAGASHDGGYVAFGTSNRAVQLWDTTTGTSRRPFEASSGFRRLAFTPDDQQLIGLGLWGRIRIWEVATGKVVRDVDQDWQGSLMEIVPLGSGLAAVTPVPGWGVISLETGKVLSVRGAPDLLTGRGAANAELGWILTIDGASRLSAWKVDPQKAAKAPNKRVANPQFPDAKVVRDAPKALVLGLAFAPGGGFVAATSDGKVTRYSADRLLYEKELEVAEGPPRALARVGDQLFVLGRKSVAVRDAETLDKAAEYPVTLPTGSVVPVFVVRGDGAEFLIGSDKVRVTDLKAKKETVVNLPRAAGGRPLTQFAYSADGKVGVARWGNTVTTVWHPKQTTDGKVLEDLKAAVSAPTNGLVLTPDGKIAILVTRAGEVRAWNTATLKVLFSEAVYKLDDGQPLPVESIAMLPDGKHFLTAGQDGRIILWDVDGFNKVKEYKIFAGTWQAALSPDGKSAILQTSGMMALLELPNSGP